MGFRSPAHFARKITHVGFGLTTLSDLGAVLSAKLDCVDNSVGV